MKKRLVVIGSVSVLAVLGAGLAWYVLRAGKHVRGGYAAPSAVTSPKSATDSAITSATGIAATQLTAQTKAFADALQSGTEMLRPDLTNVSEEFIAQVFKGLSDPTDIILVVDRYSRGDAAQRKIARAFFEYMLKTYPEERLQACGHYMLGAMERVTTADGLRVDEEALARAVKHLETVLSLPQKKYWYSAALDLLAHKWMVAGGCDAQRRSAAFEAARRYWMERYRYHESRGEHAACDACLISMFDAMETDEQLRAHFQRYKKRRFSSPKYKAAFFDNARLYRADTGDKQ